VYKHSSFERVKTVKKFGNKLSKSKFDSGTNKEQFAVRECLLSFGAEYNLYFSVLSKNIKIQIHKIIILSVVLNGCETWSLTLREERWVRVFENRVLIRIFGPKRDEIIGEWRKLHNEELNDLHSSPNIVRVINRE